MQRALPKKFALDVAYVGKHGVRIPVAYDLNAVCAMPVAGDDATCAAHRSPAVSATGANLATCTFRLLCNQFGRTGSTNFLFVPTSSNYNALQVQITKRFSRSLTYNLSYTWSKSLDLVDGIAGTVNASRNELVVTFGNYQITWDKLPTDVRVIIRKADIECLKEARRTPVEKRRGRPSKV